MTIKVYDQFIGKNSLEDIRSLESNTGYSLPDSYKLFLLENNGGRLKPNNFRTIHNEIESTVHLLYGITRESNYDLRINYDKWKEEGFPKSYLPIAIDVIGNYIVLDLVNNYGYVLFWSHDAPELRPVEISRNYDEFLKNLYQVTFKESDLYKAISRQDIKYFEERIANGEHVDDIRDEFNQAPVIMASLRNKLKLIEFFKNKGSKMGKALFSAAGNGHYESLKYLLSLGLDPDERDITQNNNTALIQAAFGGHLDVAKLLIKAGADINANDEHGQSVLRKAYWSENEELISYLENLGAKA